MVGPRMSSPSQGISVRVPARRPSISGAGRIARGGRIGLGHRLYGSRGSYQSVDTTQTVSFQDMKAAVDAAHRETSRPVAIHSYGPSGVKDASPAPATDSIEHGIDLDERDDRGHGQARTVWVPTIITTGTMRSEGEFGFAADTIPPLQAYIEKNLESTRRAFKAGVKACDGSDAVLQHVRDRSPASSAGSSRPG